jgi:hypothetical protein
MLRAEKRVSLAGVDRRYRIGVGRMGQNAINQGGTASVISRPFRGRDFYFDQEKMIFATEFTENTEKIKKKQADFPEIYEGG